LKAYIESKPLCFQDGDAKTILDMLFDVFVECKGFANEIIRKDFNALYAEMNGKTLQEMDQIIYPACTLCWDHERTGFQEGVRKGIRLAQEANIA